MPQESCVILDDYQGVALSLAPWERIADQVTVRSVKEYIGSTDALIEEIGEASILVVIRERTPLPRNILERLPNLRLIVTTGMRNASIDVAAANELGITVCGTSSSLAPTVELTWALILGAARHVVPEALRLREGGWQETLGTQLSGRMLGVIGLGRIGSEVARLGQAFHMNVQAWSPNLTAERAAAANVTLAESKAALLATSDVVTLHLVLSPTTRGIIGVEDLSLMQPGAYLVNTSRAGLVDTAALIETLEQGGIAGAAIDVFDIEPLPKDSPLRAHPKILATPHLGYVADANYRTSFKEALEDVEAFLSGNPVRQIKP